MRDGWRDTTLGEVAVLTIGRTPPRKEPRYWTDDLTYPFLSIAEMVGKYADPVGEGVTATALEEKKAKLVPAGSLLMSFKLTIGKVAFADRDLCTNEAIVWIEPRPESELTKEYLALALEAADLNVGENRAVKGATLNRASLEAIRVPVPPLEVQRRIADLIDHIDRTTEAAWGSVGRTRESLEPTWRALTADCEVLPLAERAELQRKRVNPANLGEEVLHYSIPVLDETGLPGWEPSSSIKSHKFAVPRDAVLLSLLNPRIPRIWRASGGEDVVCSTEFAVLEALDGDADDLYWSVASERFQTQLRGLVSGTTGSRQRVKPKEALSLSVPALGGKRVRAEALNAIERTAEAAQLQAERLTSMRTALLSSLLSGEHEIPDSYDRFLDVDDGQAA